MADSIIITDPTDPGYNAFVSVAEADAYFSTTYYTPGEITWESQTPEDKDKLLISASRAISALPWKGVPVNENSLLAFPRNFTLYGLAQGVYVNPPWLKPITLEYTKWLFQDKAAYLGQSVYRGIKKADVDTLSVTFQDNVGTGDFISSLPPGLLALLMKLDPLYLCLYPGKVRSMTMVF